MSDTSAPRPKAQIEQVSGNAPTGEKPYVSLHIEYDGKAAKLQLQLNALEIEREALPKVIEEEMRALVDALEHIVEETAISFRDKPIEIPRS